jgi:4-amino-4-deoxy-L-arabinose transferase-like glycosyltransferase
LIGLLLRIGMVGIDARFHPDEALFAAQARMVRYDPMLRHTDLDKPPLTFYTTALSFSLLGPSEFAARLPNVFASGISLALLYALARSLYHDRKTALCASLLWAFSPYALAFAATAFTDIQATLWVLVAALLAVRDQWRGAGIAAALVFACKPIALLFVPLILALGAARNVRTGETVLRRLWDFVWPLLIGIGLVVLWDQARAPQSFLSLGYTRNNPGRLIRSDEVLPRLETWLRWLSFSTGSDVLNIALLAGGVVWLARGLQHGRRRATATDWLIAGFGIAFLAWHWLIAFNTYDRYLHTLVPFVLLLAARVITGLWRMTHTRSGVLLALLIATLLVMIPGTLRTLRGDAPLGGDRGQHTGIDTLADYVNTHLRGQIVYDHWLGWELAYYLGTWPDVIVLYTPLPEVLADDMVAQNHPRYFVVPSPDHAAPWLAALRRAGITISTVYDDTTHRFVIYRLDSHGRAE